MRIIVTALCLAVSAWALAAPAAAHERSGPRLVDRFASEFHGAVVQPPHRASSHMGAHTRHYAPYWVPPHRGHRHHAERPHHRRHGDHHARAPVNPNVMLNHLHRRHWHPFGAIRLNRGHYHLDARDRHHHPFRLVVDAFTAQIVRAVPY